MTREEAIKNITTYLYAEFENIPKQVIEALGIAVKELGNDTNVGSKWIPCSERLPNKGEYVLASIRKDVAEHRVVIAQYDKQYYWHIGYIEAWQPLPEPYKEGKKHE